MPLVDITHDRTIDNQVLRRPAEALPDAVAGVVDCPEDPWIGPPEPGDLEMRFREKSPHDVGELNVVIEVRTTLFPSRLEDRQRRADLLRERLSNLNVERLGVWLILSEGPSSQQ
jgi:hypothetical protein